MEYIEGVPTGRKANEPDEDLPDYKPTDWRKLIFSWKFFAFALVSVAIIVLVVLVAADKNQIISKLTPIAEKIRAIPAGWLIPIAILVVLSFPPLFGHEIIAILVGLVYGLWVGFGIVAAGTVLGEIGTWFAFMYALRRRARKLELTNLNYGALGRVIREGGFWMVVIVRLSLVPSHMSTAVLSTCDVNFWHFIVAVFLSLPKQLIIVYIGTLLANNKSETLTKVLVFIAGGVSTFAVTWYIWKKMKVARDALMREQEMRRATREQDALQASDVHRNSISSEREMV